MPEEDHSDALTPADRRRRRRSGRIVFGLFLIVVLGALASTVLAVNDGRNFRRLVHQLGLQDVLAVYEPPPPPPTLRISKRSRLVTSTSHPTWLLQPEPGHSTALERPTVQLPQERCEALKGGYDSEPQFVSSDSEWECTFLETFGDAGEQASLFTQMRGFFPHGFRSFRMKLSLTDPVQQQTALDEALRIITASGLPVTTETASYLEEKIRKLTEFASILEAYRITFNKEVMDPRRFNLIILPRAETQACGGQTTPTGTEQEMLTVLKPIGCPVIRKTTAQTSHAH